jgi:hypothetical protein
LAWFYPDVYDLEAEVGFELQQDREEELAASIEGGFFRAAFSLTSSGGLTNEVELKAL